MPRWGNFHCRAIGHRYGRCESSEIDTVLPRDETHYIERRPLRLFRCLRPYPLTVDWSYLHPRRLSVRPQDEAITGRHWGAGRRELGPPKANLIVVPPWRL